MTKDLKLANMRKSIAKLGLLACALPMLYSCTDDLLQSAPSSQTGGVTLVANMENNPLTRSAISDEGKFSWMEKDQIAVLADKAQFYTFDLSAGAGSSSATFKYNGEGSLILGAYAVSPASLTPAYKDGKITVTLPAAYTSNDKNTNAPMLAAVEEGVATFKNLGGVLQIPVRSLPTGEVTFTITSSNDKKIAGAFTVTTDAQGNSIIASATDKENNAVSIKHTVEENLSHVFYVPVPVVENMNFDVTVEGGDKIGVTAAAEKVTVKRSDLIVMPALTFGNSETKNVIAENVTEANKTAKEEITKALEKGGDANVAITVTQKEIEEPIVVPALTPAAAESQVQKINMTYVNNEVPTTTKEKFELVAEKKEEQTTVAEEAQGVFEYAIPLAENVDEMKPYEVSMGNMTVKFAPTADKAAFNIVNALTAKNTFIAGKGVTINQLNIKGGNVKVEGTVKNLKNETGENVYLFLEDGAQVDKMEGDFTVIENGYVRGTKFDNEDTALGTPEDPYLISNSNQLFYLARMTTLSFADKHGKSYREASYKLTQDIVMNKLVEWTGITLENSTFDGAGHKISGQLKLKGREDDVYARGFFGDVSHWSLVKDLTLAIEYTSDEPQTIYCFGQSVNDSQILNCVNECQINGNAYNIGGFFLRATGGIFENCVNRANLTGTGAVFGFCDTIRYAKFIACRNEGNLTGFYYVLGISFTLDSTEVVGYYNKGNLTLTGDDADWMQMAGMAIYADRSIINSCWIGGKHTTNGVPHGAIVKSNYSSSISDCYWNNQSDFTQMVAEDHGTIGTTGTFAGSVPTAEQIEALNSGLAAAGYNYEFKEDGTIKPATGTVAPGMKHENW